jgi:phenylalanyl-tRNA synthetase beta chain
LSITFIPSEITDGAQVIIGKDTVGTIEVLDENLVNFELNFSRILAHVSAVKRYAPIVKHPPIIEDITVSVPEDISFEKLVTTIQSKSSLIKEIKLIDMYQHKKTLRITYQHSSRNLSNEDVEDVRKKIILGLEKELKATIS